jgi:hypothetical protein
MTEKIETLATRANEAYKDETGFLGCSAHEESLHFQFDTPQNAEGFKFKRELGGASFPLYISDDTVIEQRTQENA